jgi:hypothetical protein
MTKYKKQYVCLDESYFGCERDFSNAKAKYFFARSFPDAAKKYLRSIGEDVEIFEYLNPNIGDPEYPVRDDLYIYVKRIDTQETKEVRLMTHYVMAFETAEVRKVE